MSELSPLDLYRSVKGLEPVEAQEPSQGQLEPQEGSRGQEQGGYESPGYGGIDPYGESASGHGDPVAIAYKYGRWNRGK